MMVTTGEKGPGSAKESQRSTPGPSKIIKKIRERKQSKSLQPDALLEAAADNSTESESLSGSRDKKLQGIVIDGKTYTCATCKTGHRVGVCKHARDRPMTATHPPGRPPAGAPKKIVCDCPKLCNCKKRDCKCARRCNCTQSMYMLVYVSAPGGEEQENVEDERGIWKLGEQVITDLKGNVLTPEQVKERREHKEREKLLPRESRIGNVLTLDTKNFTSSTSPEADIEQKVGGGCCTHKEKVVSRNIAADASPYHGQVSQSATDGCNCGHTCACAFCPQHPNNATSINMAREQITYWANNQSVDYDQQSIVSFMPNVPQGASCMGGAPQFAMSRTPGMPSAHNIQNAFPGRGYVLSYPIKFPSHGGSPYPVGPFHMQQLQPELGMMSNSVTHDLPNSIMTPHSDLPSLEFTQDEFGIGDAFVSSAGIGTWNTDLMSPEQWALPSNITTPMNNTLIEAPDYLSRSIDQSSLVTMPMASDKLEFGHDSNDQDDGFFNMLATPQESVRVDTMMNVPSHGSCCNPQWQPDVGVETPSIADEVLRQLRNRMAPALSVPHG